jgi:hypothetical protein
MREIERRLKEKEKALMAIEMEEVAKKQAD